MNVSQLRNLLAGLPDAWEVAIRYETYVVADIKEVCRDDEDLGGNPVVSLIAGDRR